MNLRGKRVLVVGLERTGEALCNFLLRQGAQVKVSEIKRKEELGEKISFWESKGVTIEAGKHKEETFLEPELIVLSPGIPWIPEVEAAANKGIKIYSEIELAYRFLKGKIVGITGTNGKSTTAALTYKILKDGELRACLAGNIGTPLIHFAEKSKDEDIYVTEISSFQLKHIEQFKADISVLLNISPDHIDWHLSFDDYYESKKKLILSQKECDVAILNRDDPLIWKLTKEEKIQIFAFSREREVEKGCFLRGDWIMLKDKREEKLMRISDIPLLGAHNQENIMAGALVGHVLGIPAPEIRESVMSFQGLEHRLEKVSTINGIDFYNDSKATNVDAALKSIQSFDRDIILILGGRDKGSDFERLRNSIKKRVRRVILLGEAKKKIQKSLETTVPMEVVSSLRNAVRKAHSRAKAGEVVLLAPACTSFDMFQNFEERGKVFKQEVLALKKELAEKRT